MSYKLLALFACLAVASAASIPEEADLREAFETEDAIYIPISTEEAAQLRLPRSAPRLDLPESSLAYIPDVEEEAIEEPSAHHGRVEEVVEEPTVHPLASSIKSTIHVPTDGFFNSTLHVEGVEMQIEDIFDCEHL